MWGPVPDWSSCYFYCSPRWARYGLLSLSISVTFSIFSCYYFISDCFTLDKCKSVAWSCDSLNGVWRRYQLLCLSSHETRTTCTNILYLTELWMCQILSARRFEVLEIMEFLNTSWLVTVFASPVILVLRLISTKFEISAIRAMFWLQFHALCGPIASLAVSVTSFVTQGQINPVRFTSSKKLLRTKIEIDPIIK